MQMTQHHHNASLAGWPPSTYALLWNMLLAMSWRKLLHHHTCFVNLAEFQSLTSYVTTNPLLLQMTQRHLSASLVGWPPSTCASLSATLLLTSWAASLHSSCFVAVHNLFTFASPASAYQNPSIVAADDTAPPQSKSRWLATFYLCIPVGYAAGYILGGIIAPALGWRAVFLLEAFAMLPFALFCAVGPAVDLRGKPQHTSKPVDLCSARCPHQCVLRSFL